MAKLLISLLLSAVTSLALAVEPVTFILPNSPGSATDTLGRTVARLMEEKYNQPTVAENHPGADQVIGLNRFLNLQKPGLIFGGTTMHVFAPVLNPKAADTSDIEVLGVLGQGPNVWFVNPKLKITTAQELVNAIKNNRKLNIGSDYLSNRVNAFSMVEYYKSSNINVVPYKTGSQVIIDVVSGNLDIGVLPATPALIGQAESGQVIIVANTSDHPLKVGNDTIPSIVPHTKAPQWVTALFVSTNKNIPLPAGFEANLAAVLNSEEFKKATDKIGFYNGTSNKAAAQKLVARYQEQLKKLNPDLLK